MEGGQLAPEYPYAPWSHFASPDRRFIDKMFDANDARYDPEVLLDQRRGDTYDRNGDGIIQNGPGEVDEIPANPPHDAHSLKYTAKGANIAGGAKWSGGVQYVNVHIMRYGEVLLNLAEAYTELNQGANALVPLNMIRARARLSDITTTDQAQLRQIILDERAKEFSFEGYRFFDLKRAGKLAEVLGPLGWQSHMTVFPIPQTEIDLTQMEQNPGF